MKIKTYPYVFRNGALLYQRKMACVLNKHGLGRHFREPIIATSSSSSSSEEERPTKFRKKNPKKVSENESENDLKIVEDLFKPGTSQTTKAPTTKAPTTKALTENTTTTTENTTPETTPPCPKPRGRKAMWMPVPTAEDDFVRRSKRGKKQSE